MSCHDDLTAADLTGRYLLKGGDTVWVDGPLTRAVREGAICYLDEVVEARKDVTVVLHPLTDDRRLLPLERTGELRRHRTDPRGNHLPGVGLEAALLSPRPLPRHCRTRRARRRGVASR